MQGAESGAAAGSSFGPWGAVAGGVIGGLMGSGGQDAAAKAAQDNLDFQKQMYQQQDPFSAGGNRAQYVPKLNELATGGPSSVANDPMFKQMNDQSMNAIESRMASQGQGVSTANMQALQSGQQGNQMSYWQNMMQTYAGLSGESGGRTSPMKGIDPNTAMVGANQTASNYGSSFGMFAGGLQSIFGNGSGSNATTDANNAMSGATTGNTMNYGST